MVLIRAYASVIEVGSGVVTIMVSSDALIKFTTDFEIPAPVSIMIISEIASR